MEEFLKAMILKVLIWVLAKGWVSKTARTLKKEWHQLWPAVASEYSPDISEDRNLIGHKCHKTEELCMS